MPVIAKVVVKAGSAWPAINEEEGAPMDDLILAKPVPLILFDTCSLEPGGVSSFQLQGPPGTTLVLQRTDDLSVHAWVGVATNMVGSDALVTFTNVPVTGVQGYYRAVAE